MATRASRVSNGRPRILSCVWVASLAVAVPVAARPAHARELPATVDSGEGPFELGPLARLTSGSHAGNALDRGLAKLSMDSGAMASLRGGDFGGGTRGSSGEIGTVKRAMIRGPIDDAQSTWAKKDASFGFDDAGLGRGSHSVANADPGTIARAIKSRYVSGVKYCYVQARRSQPELSGKVEMTLLVGMSGRVIYARAAGGTSSEVSSCMVAQARRWQVEPPQGSESVQVAVAFLLR